MVGLVDRRSLCGADLQGYLPVVVLQVDLRGKGWGFPCRSFRMILGPLGVVGLRAVSSHGGSVAWNSLSI